MNTDKVPDPRLIRLSTALLVEEGIRRQSRAVDLYHQIVDASTQLHGHELAFLVLRKYSRYQLVAATSVSQVDHTGPMAQWIEKFCQKMANSEGYAQTVTILEPDVVGLPDDEWAQGLPGFWLWLPLRGAKGRGEGALILTRRTPWQEQDRLLAEPMAGCYGHAIWAMHKRLPDLPDLSKKQWLGIVAGFLLLFFMPVRLDTLAPAEVASAHTIVVTAPFDGIIADIAVKPYQSVSAGDTLLTFDARELAMKRDVAARSLDVAEAELSTLRNQAFMDPDSKSKIAVAEQKAELERENLNYAEERFRQRNVIAEIDGVVLFDDRFSWKGRPVTTGLALITIAKPEKKEIRIDLPIAALIPTQVGADVRLFLDMDPSVSVKAKLSRLGYEARPLPGGGLAYRFVADLTDSDIALHLGARGTAKIYGEQVSLAYYLFRRPIAAIRQVLGF